jgi:uncharacterized NAD(P)/FAD-binding protein YdhS
MQEDQMPKVAIAGGGASGILAAVHLLNSLEFIRVHLFTAGCSTGGGIAYSASSDELLLNVAASCMSAWSERPDDFYLWLEQHHPGRYAPSSFVPRRLFREYLQTSLEKEQFRGAADRLVIHPTWVRQVLPKKRGFLIQANENDEVLVDAVVLCMGNCLSSESAKCGPGAVDDPRYLYNGWCCLNDSPSADAFKDVLVLGTGLTSVDVILRLRASGHRGKIVAMSRRGQWPQDHSAYPRLENFTPPDLEGLSPRQLMRKVRAAIRAVIAQGGNWRQVIDGLRPVTNKIWSKWNFTERSRFLRHVRPYWDSVRHRMAPDVAAKFRKAVSDQAVILQVARLVSILPEDEGLQVRFRRRGTQQTESMAFGQVINCTGTEVLKVGRSQSLVEKLIQLDLARLDPLLPGLLTNEIGEIVDATNHPIPNLFAMGPVRRGTLWETTAIPEIRAQAEQLAKDILTSVQNTNEPEADSPLHAGC